MKWKNYKVRYAFSTRQLLPTQLSDHQFISNTSPFS